jgi:hypothetical protein
MEIMTALAASNERPGLSAWYCPNCGAADSGLVQWAVRSVAKQYRHLDANVGSIG